MINTGKIWYSPPRVYGYIEELKKKDGIKHEQIYEKPEYQKVREALAASVAGLVMFKFTKMPAFVQLYKNEPPYAYVMMAEAGHFNDQIEIPDTEIGQSHITPLEITSYLTDLEGSLLDQLKKKKIPPGAKVLDPHQVLLVHVGIGLTVDIEPLREHLNATNTPFPVWLIQEKQLHPDTIVTVTIVNPQPEII